MTRETWVVQVESKFVAAWYSCGPEYVSEEVAHLAIKSHWQENLKNPLRVRRVA